MLARSAPTTKRSYHFASKLSSRQSDPVLIMRILIKVTKDILEQSAYCGFTKGGFKIPSREANIGRNCAIANAVCELFDTAWIESRMIGIYKSVPDFEMMNKREYVYRIPLPLKAIEFISEFDNCPIEQRKQMNPISFEIDVPDEVIESIGISEAERIISNSLTMEKV